MGVFIELSKAFDTVDHKILLEKLSFYGIGYPYLKWFKSYLSNRKQCVSFGNDEKTTELEVVCGVPQGSILGPLLFLLYVNDLPRASKLLEPIMFADDTNLFYAHRDLEVIFNVVNRELNNICEWFRANKLSLNAGKTKYLIFHTCKKQIPNLALDIFIDGQKVTRENSTKFLGVLLDENLNWKQQIDNVCKKVSKGIGIIYSARAFLNKDLLKQLYFAYIHSHISYCNIAWASTYKTNLQPLKRRQKHALRVISFKKKDFPSKPLFLDMNILDIYAVNIFQILCLVYKCRENLAPEIFKSVYTLKPIGKYSMRSSSNEVLKEPFYRNNYQKFSFSFRGPRMWNSVAASRLELLDNTSFANFKNILKKILVNHEDILSLF